MALRAMATKNTNATLVALGQMAAARSAGPLPCIAEARKAGGPDKLRTAHTAAANPKTPMAWPSISRHHLPPSLVAAFAKSGAHVRNTLSLVVITPSAAIVSASPSSRPMVAWVQCHPSSEAMSASSRAFCYPRGSSRILELGGPTRGWQVFDLHAASD